MTKEMIIKKLNKLDFLALRTVYEMRCLSVKQIWEHFYKKHNINYEDFYNARIIPLSNLKVIDIKTSNSGVCVVFLTTLGVEIVRNYFGLPSEIYDDGLKKNVSGVQSAKTLDMNQRLIDHQITLNEYVLKFKHLSKRQYPNESFKYFDEKFTSRYSIIRPDGIITVGNLDLFLEMDMGTESKKQLDDKWNRYRRFLNNNSTEFSGRKIIVLFIVKCEKIEARKNLVRSSAEEVFTSLLKDNFEIYIGSEQELLNAVFKKILPIYYSDYTFENLLMKKLLKEKHGFSAVRGNKLKVNLQGSSYGYYIRKLDKNRHIVRQDNTIQEFLVDEYIYSPLSVIGKIYFAERTSTQFNLIYKRKINYLVVVSDIKTLYEHLKCLKMFSTPMVFFTTPERLKAMDFNEAIFRIDKSGNIFHCSDYGYKTMVFEKNILE